MPRASIQAIEPPPAPIDSTSTSDSAVQTPMSSPRLRRAGLTVFDDGHVEAGATHVAGDQVVDVELPRDGRGCGDARRGP